MAGARSRLTLTLIYIMSRSGSHNLDFAAGLVEEVIIFSEEVIFPMIGLARRLDSLHLFQSDA
jgi:hypothetical protein